MAEESKDKSSQAPKANRINLNSMFTPIELDYQSLMTDLNKARDEILAVNSFNERLRKELDETKASLLRKIEDQDKLINELDSTKRTFEVNINTIEKAINECNLQLGQYRKMSSFILTSAIAVFPGIFTFIWMTLNMSSELRSLFVSKLENFLVGASALGVVIFGVLMALYRYFLNEMSKIEGNKIGFMRISIAANNSPEGFGTEVRKALATTAFETPSKKKTEKIESPLPGHPSSDVVTIVLNKILDGFEIVSKKQPS